jgi:Domain of unknown function (DUF4145)
MTGCAHCGYAGALEQKGEHVKAQSTTQHAEDYGDFEVSVVWALFRCAQCGEPTLGSYVWAEEFFDPEDVEIVRVWPRPADNQALPPNVRSAYDLARRGRSVDPAFYAVGVRRTLEAICDNEGVPRGRGQTLEKRLDDLAATGRLPDELASVTTSLRRVGNLGAHEGLGEIQAADVPAVADLMEALLEYLYRAPSKLAAVRASFAARGVNL